MYSYKSININIFFLYLKFYQNFKSYHVSKLNKTYSMSHFSMPYFAVWILWPEISVTNVCRLRYFADFDFKSVLLGQNNFK